MSCVLALTQSTSTCESIHFCITPPVHTLHRPPQQPRDDPDDESASDDHMVLTRSAGKVARVAPPVPPQTRAAPRHQSVESSASFDPFAESEGESELDDEDMPDELESDYSPNSSPARHRSGKGGKGDKPKPTRAILSKHCEVGRGDLLGQLTTRHAKNANAGLLKPCSPRR